MKIRALLRRALGAAAGVFVALVALVLALTATETGSRLLISTVSKAAGDSLSIATTEGRLGEHFALLDVRLSSPAARVTIDRIELAWDVRALFIGVLHLQPLKVHGVRITLAAASSPSEPALEVPAAPIWLTLKDAEITDLALDDGHNTTSLERLAFTLRWRGRTARLEDFHVELPEIGINGRLSARHGTPPVLDAAIRIEGRYDEQPVALSLDTSGPLDALAVAAQFAQPYVGSVNGRVDVLAATFDLQSELEALAAGGVELTRARLAASGNAREVRVELATELAAPAFAARMVRIEGQASTATDFASAARFNFKWVAAAVTDAGEPRLAGHAEGSFDGERITVRHIAEPPYVSTLDLVLGNLSGAPAIELNLAVERWQLALPELGAIVIEGAALRASGTADDLELSASAALDTPQLGALNLDLSGNYRDDAFNIAALNAALLDGSVSAAGRAQWRDRLAVTATFSARELNLARVRADLDTTLALAGEFKLSDGDKGLHTEVTVGSIGGRWRGHALSGQAGISVAGDLIEIRDAALALGDNTLAGRLSIKPRLAGVLSIEFQDFSVLAADLRGALSARTEIGGTRAAPLLKSTLDGRGLAFSDWSLKRLTGDVDVNLGAEDVQSVVALHASGVRNADFDVGELTLDGQGTRTRHGLTLALKGPHIQLDAAAHGGADTSRWRGALEALRVNADHAGEWVLREAATIAFEDDAVSVEQACLTRQDAEVCVAADQLSATGGKASARIAELPLALANDFVPRTLSLAGTLGGDARVYREQDNWLGDARLATSGGVISVTTGSDDVQRIAIKNLSADLAARADSFDVKANGDVSDWFAFDVALSQARSAAAELTGTATLRARDIAWLGEFVPRVAGTRGGAEMDLVLGGSLPAPALDVRAQLVDGRIYFPDVGLDINALALTGSSAPGDPIALAVELGSGAGKLTIAGQVTASAAQHWPTQVTISGTDFPIVRLPEGEADISPDLRIDASTEHADIKGVLRIPHVNVLAPPPQASVVAVSADEVIINPGDGAAAVEDGSGTPDFLVDAVTGDVEIILGDDVHINAVGLTSTLSGQLRWLKARGEILGRADGRLRIVNGSYAAYGQRLDIAKGDLIFAGPLDNPAVDLRAVRPDLDVLAGVSVTGRVQQPAIALYSQPAMSDSDILAYLITGRPLGDSSSSEAGLVAQAALSLGAEQSSIVTSQIQNAFGLDEFGVSAGESATSSSLVAGKRITPKLSVRADFNPFDRLWTIFLNYKLTNTWSVEAESGESKGADLLYTHERHTLLPDFGADKP